MEETLTSEEKVEIVESFSNYTSWIDNEEASEIYEVSAEVAEQHQIPSSADLGYLFWSEEPFATQAANTLNDLRNKYGQRMQQAFRNEIVKTDSEYEDFGKWLIQNDISQGFMIEVNGNFYNID